MIKVDVQITATINTDEVDSVQELLERLNGDVNVIMLVDDDVEEISVEVTNIEVQETE